ncbi:Asp23/Gls24 family envelope stress response protein [Lentzea sp. HUAS TT2]|uniref:Asp23/Gls24 family envelope stress response protein n=1 Tax=Lentzea sp. HUAS TT2 TaxID=3447454 RepID=UPI003F6F67BB
MIIQVSDAAGAVSRVESVITEPVIAAIAAIAATSVAGVTRLEPGLTGLVASMARTARQRVKNLDPAPTEGVRVSVLHAPGTGVATVSLEIDLAVSGLDQAAAVAQTVQRTVARAVTAATGLSISSVSVFIVDVGVPRGGLG